MSTKKDFPLYLDAAASNPLHPEVLEKYISITASTFGNADGNHNFGIRSRRVVEESATQIAQLLHIEPEEIIFTSGATEAINLGIQGAFLARLEVGMHIITAKTEHKAVLKTVEHLESICAEISFVDLDEYGAVDLEALKALIRPDTSLVAIMHVNNETGVINDIQEVSKICAQKGITFFTDATQAVGHVACDYSNDDYSLIAVSAHKFGGPIGIGALIRKGNVPLQPILFGGGATPNIRPGTLATPLIAAFGKACEVLNRNFALHILSLQERSVKTEDFLKKFALEFVVPRQLRSPHIIPTITTEVNALTFLQREAKTFAASTGSACNSGIWKTSHVANELKCISNPNHFVRFSITTHPSKTQ